MTLLSRQIALKLLSHVDWNEERERELTRIENILFKRYKL